MAKNQDQASKTISGAENNKENTRFFRDEWANTTNKLFCGSEVTCIHTEKIYGGMCARTYHIQIDQLIVAVCEKKRMAIVVYIDGTTSFAGERVATKANEGAVMHYIKRESEEIIIRKFNHLCGYKFVHILGVLLPDGINKSLKDVKKKEQDAKKFFIGVNYATIGKYSSDENKNGMDFAMRKSELSSVLNEIVENENKYEINKGVIARVWIEQKGNDFGFMPNLILNDESAALRREHLLYCLKNDSHNYTTKARGQKNAIDQVTAFLMEHNVAFKKNLKQSIKLEMVIEYIENNYPQQTEFSMLNFIRMYRFLLLKR